MPDNPLLQLLGVNKPATDTDRRAACGKPGAHVAREAQPLARNDAGRRPRTPPPNGAAQEIPGRPSGAPGFPQARMSRNGFRERDFGQDRPSARQDVRPPYCVYWMDTLKD
jgi:hypothetical protein